MMPSEGCAPKTRRAVQDRPVSHKTLFNPYPAVFLNSFQLLVNLDNIRAVGQALFRAIAHVGAASSEASGDVIDLLCDHLAEVRADIHSANESEMGEHIGHCVQMIPSLNVLAVSYGNHPTFQLSRLCAFHTARAHLGSIAGQAVDRQSRSCYSSWERQSRSFIV